MEIEHQKLETGYDRRRNQIKKFMCPLKDKCPDIVY